MSTHENVDHDQPGIVTAHDVSATAVAEPTPDARCGPPQVEVVGLDQHVGNQQTLHEVTFEVQPGEVLAIAGGSGAGKSTLLEAMVGLRPASGGEVLVDGVPFDPQSSDVPFGYVPQEDIIHLELPLRRTLEHAARLRMPAGTTSEGIRVAVDHTLARLDLCDRGDVKVGSLSGGQRKRASIASELLTDPHLFFLDEPTSGLDPATGAGVMRQLRRLAESGTTIVVTTHAPADLNQADRIVFLAKGGHLAFIGTPDEARAQFGVDDLADIYEIIANETVPVSASPETPQRPDRTTTTRRHRVDRECDPRRELGRRRGVVSQTHAQARRNLDLLLRNRLTLAILLGSPIFVIGMKTMLFGRGAFDATQPSAMPAIQIIFWLSFSSVFFGVTYGLLQIVGEFAIFRRERFAGVSPVAYVAAKLAVLAPLLAGVNVAMLAAFRIFGRLPAMPLATWLALGFTLTLVSLAAVGLGLLASAAVRNPAQATLALPMLCFPQVLFAGAVVAIGDMSSVAQAHSYPLAGRWGFESMGRILDLDEAVGSEAAAVGYVDSFSGSPAQGWAVLTVIIVAAVGGTVTVLHRRTRS